MVDHDTVEVLRQEEGHSGVDTSNQSVKCIRFCPSTLAGRKDKALFLLDTTNINFNIQFLLVLFFFVFHLFVKETAFVYF